MKIDNFFTSGMILDNSNLDLKSKFQMINIAIVLSSTGLLYGIIGNYIRSTFSLIPIELFLLTVNVLLFFALRKNPKSFKYVSFIITAQFSLLFIFLVYISEPYELKHVWLFTFPIIVLYLQSVVNAVYWFFIVLTLLLIAPIQNYIDVSYSMYQVSYIAFVFTIVALIVYFYKLKMDEAKDIILAQQDRLLGFNTELEKKVKDKTSELLLLNSSLEETVNLKMQELIKKDKLITVQSKQAVMGEMISMIAHQWRQPLSTVTLQVSNLQVKKLLGVQDDCEAVFETLNHISNTIVYLSDTIDDFQTYFNPTRELVEIEVHELLQKAVSFTLPRLEEIEIDLKVEKQEDIFINTYVNELIQVILNILNNAVDVFLTLQSTKPIISLSAQTIEDSISIKIKDNASGISDENLPFIFEPYFSTKGKNGTGLGLYMSQMIIEKQFSGTINVETSKDGTVFSIDIPRNR